MSKVSMINTKLLSLRKNLDNKHQKSKQSVAAVQW